jgi:thiol-disulfide isomerase/thioredoxin
MFRFLALVFALWTLHARAEIPDGYKPIIVKPPFSFSERLIDLSVAMEKANSEKKPLYIYLGAGDCPPCREYEFFLSKNLPALKESFDRVIVVDIRTWLKGPDLIFKVGEKRYSLAEFKTLVGDKNKLLTYPYFWYISPELKQLKQLPRGSRNYLQVADQLEILRLP